ncbi:MAG TPA: MBL fold metallo-hydrolase [Caldimonas sp.]|jgi:metallo-beta-lactamase class B|nr:MBL fold metallo-hydrolase [Caldimonas sp.]HEX2539696.1 MBL fold metallo-hydrolase [Caldimonas sp.]
MKTRRSIVWGAIYAMVASTVSGPALAQTAPTVESLQASAKFYAGTDWMGTYTRLCVPTISAANRVLPTYNPANYPSGDLPTPPGGTPPRENWYSPPAQIGDNLYFLGTRNHSSFALVARNGDIIVLDGNFEYATEDEIHRGLRFLGLDPQKVRYSIYSHAHGDHDGGAHLTEAAFPNATIVYGEGDWPSVLARTVPHATRFGPQNDGTDGRVIRVGDVSVQIVTMPGHTPGTLSFLFEFRDRGQPIRVAYVGGTAISFTNPMPAFYDQYIQSAQKFAQRAAAFGATALMSNHTEFDNAYFRANTAAMIRVLREDDQGGQNNRRGNRQGNPRNDANVPDVPNRLLRDVPNPYEVGQREVLNYFAVVELCAKSAKLRATGVL